MMESNQLRPAFIKACKVLEEVLRGKRDSKEGMEALKTIRKFASLREKETARHSLAKKKAK